MNFSEQDKQNVRTWLSDAYAAASDFDGSEAAENNIVELLSPFDDFARVVGEGASTPALEQQIVQHAFPEHPDDMPESVNDFLGYASQFYDRLKDANGEAETFDLLSSSGAVINQSDKVFVKTDEGQLGEAGSDTPQKYEVRTQPRLAMLIEHLKNDGVNGEAIYTDDLVITRGQVDQNMMREHPYNIVQIPRLDMEIAVCDQVGETTFVKQGTVGEVFWDHMSKDDLKGRDDVWNVNRHNDAQWWNEISDVLSGNAPETHKKVKVESWNNKKPKLDIDLIKESLWAHREATGKWLSDSAKAVDEHGVKGKKGSYVFEHGPYAGLMTVNAVANALRVDGSRGLKGKSSIAKINEEISDEKGLTFVNIQNQDDFNIDLIKESLWAHREATGKWLSNGEKAIDENGVEGTAGSYVLEHGPYATQVKVHIIDSNLRLGRRGLQGGSSIAALNEEISDERGLSYVNITNQANLDIDLIKESLWAHREATGTWLSESKRAIDSKGNKGVHGSYVLEHGPYAQKLKVSTLVSALYADGGRGLDGVTTIAKLNKEISDEKGLSYVNHLEKDSLDTDLIKESLWAHREATGKWLSSSARSVGTDGIRGGKGSYILEHGPYAGLMTVRAISSALHLDGSRGLKGKSSIAKINEEISDERGLGYINNMQKNDLDIDLIRHGLLMHRLVVGKWLSSSSKAMDEKGDELPTGSFVLEHGQYSGEITARNLEATLRQDGQRGVKGKSSIANEVDVMAKNLDVDGETRFERKCSLGDAIDDFHDDLLDQFDGNEDRVMAHVETLKLDDLYTALAPYMQMQSQLLHVPDQPDQGDSLTV